MSNLPSAHEIHGQDIHRQRFRALELYKQSPAAAIEKYPEFIPDFAEQTNPAQAELELYRRTGQAYYNPAEENLIEEGINTPGEEK